jgi:hypothetical protein
VSQEVVTLGNSFGYDTETLSWSFEITHGNDVVIPGIVLDELQLVVSSASSGCSTMRSEVRVGISGRRIVLDG